MYLSPQRKENQELRHYIQLFLIGLALVLAAKGIALFPLGFSVDSYPKLLAMSEDTNARAGTHAELLYRELMGQGRVGQWALNEALTALGIVGPGGNTLYVLLALCCYVGVGVLLCRLWRIEDSLGIQVCIVGIFAIHPYHAEIFTFREATLTVGLALLLAMLGLVVAERRLSRWVMGTTLMVLSLTLYQVAMNYVVISVAILALLDLTRSDARRAFGYPGLDSGKQFFKELLPRASAVVAAVLVYVPVHKLSQQAVSWTFEHSRGAMLPLSDMAERIWHSTMMVGRVFLVPEAAMPIASKMLIVALAALAIGLLARKIWGTAGSRRYVMLALAFSLLGLAGLAIIGVMIPLKNWVPIDRTLSGVSVLVAGFFALAVRNGGVWTSRAALAIVCVLLFGFAGATNVILSEQLRLNARDMATASRMIARLEENPKFAAVKKIAVVGVQPEYPLRFVTAKFQVNKSAFGQPWSKANVLQEVSGYRFLEPNPDERRQAEDYCSDVRPWPDSTSITVLDAVGVICLRDREPVR